MVVQKAVAGDSLLFPSGDTKPSPSGEGKVDEVALRRYRLGLAGIATFARMRSFPAQRVSRLSAVRGQRGKGADDRRQSISNRPRSRTPRLAGEGCSVNNSPGRLRCSSQTAQVSVGSRMHMKRGSALFGMDRSQKGGQPPQRTKLSKCAFADNMSQR